MKQLLIVLAVLTVLIIGGVPAYAQDGVEAQAFIGTYFTATSSAVEGTESLNLQREDTDLYGTAEIAYRYGSLRPFASVEYQKDVFQRQSIGADYAITPMLGVRGAWVTIDTEGVETRQVGLAGITIKYQ